MWEYAPPSVEVYNHHPVFLGTPPVILHHCGFRVNS